MLESAIKMINLAAKRLGLSQKEINDLLKPDHNHEVVLDVDGKKYDAYRV
jgi:hypothetical protein